MTDPSITIYAGPLGSFKSPLERVIWTINNLPLDFLRAKPWPGPIWVSLEDFQSITADLREWCANNDQPFMFGETSIGMVGPLVKGVVIAAVQT
jgi:hypothetical protein